MICHRRRWSLDRLVATAVLLSVVAVAVAARVPGASGTTHASVACGAATPSLINGSFEELPNLPTSDGEDWREFNGGNPPHQFLLVKDTVAADRIPGWRTSASDDYIEIQRQVAGYEQDGTDTASGYWDRKAPQPGDGSYWAELNAYQASALYQDISAVAGQTYYWSILHRGRVFGTPDVMKVWIGPVGALVEQTSIWKFAPTNTDKFVGVPTFGVSGTNVSTISTKLDDGWTKYQGEYQATATGPVRFQFGAVTASFENRVGNLLDGISFSVFEACDATRTLDVNQVVTLDMTDPEFVMGDGHSLQSVSVLSGTSGTVTTNGSQVVFSGVSAGITQVRYTVSATLNGGSQTRSATLTYTVNSAPTTTAATTAPPTTAATTTVPATTAPPTTAATTTVPVTSTSDPETATSTVTTIPDPITTTTESWVGLTGVDSTPSESSPLGISDTPADDDVSRAGLPITGGWDEGLVLVALGMLALGLVGLVTKRFLSPVRSASGRSSD